LVDTNWFGARTDCCLSPLGATIAEPDLDLVVIEARIARYVLSQIVIRVVGFVEYGLQKLDLSVREASS